MRSLAKLSYLFPFVSLIQHARAQSTTSLYVPTIAESGGLGNSFFIGSFGGTQDGRSWYQLVLGSDDDDDDDGAGPNVTLNLIEASTTAILFASTVEDGATMSINIECSVNGGSSNCVETDLIISGTLTSSSLSSFTEAVSPVPVTLVSTLPPPTPGPTDTIPLPTSLSGFSPSSPGGSPSAPFPSPSPQTLSGSPTSSVSSSTTTPSAVSPSGSIGSTNSSTSVLNPPNSAESRVLTMPIFVLSLVFLSIVLQ